MIHPKEYKHADEGEKRLALAEERTVLAYVRTFLTVLGLLVILIKVYFEEGGWLGVVISFMIALLSVIFIELFVRVRRERKKKRPLDIKIKVK